MFKKIPLITTLFLLALPLGLQAFQETSMNNNLVAEVSPTSPGAGETVTIGLSSYGFKINTSVISWYVDNELKSRGIGTDKFSFNLGPVGVQTKISVYVQARGGQKASKTFIFDPTELELFWETKTSKPGPYKGKALPSAGAKIKIVALPYIVSRSGQKIDPAKLSYTWKKNGAILTNLSGVGKNVISLETDKGASQVKLEVEAKSVTDNITANENVVINLVSPEVLFYEKKPLEGVIYGKIIPKEYPLFEEEVTIKAEPYFLPLGNDNDYKYSWQIDRSNAQGKSDDPQAITLRRSTEVSGSNLVNFLAQSLLSSANNSFIIKYGNGLLKPLQ